MLATRSRDGLIQALRVIQVHLCAYRNARFCDCKYGLTEQSVGKASEMGNGCPEVRDAIAVLESMNEKEFQTFVTRHRQHVSPPREDGETTSATFELQGGKIAVYKQKGSNGLMVRGDVGLGIHLLPWGANMVLIGLDVPKEEEDGQRGRKGSKSTPAKGSEGADRLRDEREHHVKRRRPAEATSKAPRNPDGDARAAVREGGTRRGRGGGSGSKGGSSRSPRRS